MSRVASIVFRSAFLLLASLGSLGATGALASTDVGSINFTAGYKNLTSDWNLDQLQYDVYGQPLPQDRALQPALGLETTWGRKAWPVHVAFDIQNSSDDGLWHVPAFFTEPAYDLRLRANVLEVGLGARRAFDLKWITPYLGAGGLWARAKVEVDVSDPNSGQFGTPTGHGHARSSSLGYWVGGGLYRRLGPRFQMGVAYRYSKATLDAKPFTVDSGSIPSNTGFPAVDGGGRTINFIVGWSYPSH